MGDGPPGCSVTPPSRAACLVFCVLACGCKSGVGVIGAGPSGGTAATMDGGGDACIPTAATETMCDGIDEDCNGKVDDVDLNMDGFCDCLRIGILGRAGPNPSSEFQTWLIARGPLVERFHDTPDPNAKLELSHLQRFDVVLLDDLANTYQAADARMLGDYVTQGGGVVSLTGYRHDSPALPRDKNDLLAELGIGYDPRNAFSEPAVRFADHPAVMGLAEVSFWGGYDIDLSRVSRGRAEAVAWTASDRVVGAVLEVGKGRLFIWGDEWVEYDSEWRMIPDIPVFWSQVLLWVGPRNYCQIPSPL